MIPVRYSEAFQVQVQPGFRSLIDKAALSTGQKPTEWARQALAEALRVAGFDPAPKPSLTASELYDDPTRHNGQTRWAWVEAGQITAIGWHDDKPADGWLPVVHVDSEPFDSALHWRLSPVYSIEADKVVCTYPLVDKARELA